MRILIATESQDERALIGEALYRRDGVEKVVFASDGVEAYIALGREQPDLAIVSGTLGRIDGVILVRTIARARNARRTRTLLLLDREQAQDRDVVSARPTAIALRPLTRAQLLERVDGVLLASPVAAPVVVAETVR